MTRRVLVTGGNRGIGLAIARAFADAGDQARFRKIKQVKNIGQAITQHGQVNRAMERSVEVGRDLEGAHVGEGDPHQLGLATVVAAGGVLRSCAAGSCAEATYGCTGQANVLTCASELLPSSSFADTRTNAICACLGRVYSKMSLLPLFSVPERGLNRIEWYGAAFGLRTR